jgi:hypothetical protein
VGKSKWGEEEAMVDQVGRIQGLASRAVGAMKYFIVSVLGMKPRVSTMLSMHLYR